MFLKRLSVVDGRKILLLFTVVLCLNSNHAFSWGFHAHKLIHRKAVFTLPPEMIGFFKQHIDYLSEHAVDPDIRRHSDDQEAPRHYIDLEFYERFNESKGIDSVPYPWQEAVIKYSEDSLFAWGKVPWVIESNYYQLVDAFNPVMWTRFFVIVLIWATIFLMLMFRCIPQRITTAN